MKQAAYFGIPRSPNSATERSDLSTDQIRVLAALHSADPTSLGLEDFGRPGKLLRPTIQSVDGAVSGQRNNRHKGHGIADPLAWRQHAD